MNFADWGKKTSNKTLQPIRCSMNKHEPLDPLQEEDRNTDQKYLKEDLEQGIDKDSNKSQRHTSRVFIIRRTNLILEDPATKFCLKQANDNLVFQELLDTYPTFTNINLLMQ
jgi:hypothetical protein